MRRHLAIFDGSRDRNHYERLKKYLYYYRLAFGQARQQDLLDRIVDHPDEVRLRAELQACMVNLSPFQAGYSWEQAQRDASAMIAKPYQLRALLNEVRAMSACRTKELDDVAGELEGLCDLVESVAKGESKGQAHDVRAIAALIYLLNPHDDVFDGMVGGLQDDVRVIRTIAGDSSTGHTH
jgi:hypothetical protein